jgi:imidazolonepropionase-like amidohydrolase
MFEEAIMLVLKNASVIDGLGTAPVKNAVIVVDGGRIESVGTDIRPPDGADVVMDLKGKYALPGLIDAHVHFGGTDRLDYPGIGDRHETYDFLPSRTKALKWGITTVRSAGDYTPEIFEFRDEAKRGQHISPRIVAAGKMIQARGGHPMDTVFGSNKKIADGAAILTGDTTDIDAEIKKLADAGTDWVKAVISEVNKMDYPAPVPRIPGEKIKQIVEISHKYGKPCMIHVDNTRHMREAAEAGADSIEHVFSVGATETDVDDGLIDMLLKKQIYVVPTIYSIKAHENPGGSMPLVYEKLIAQVKRLIGAGVKIGVGTDASIPFVPIGETLHEELSQLVLCGMTPMEAIIASTSGNAKLLRMEKEIGSILPGYRADLVIVDGDPAEDISKTKNIYTVIINGRIV